MSDGIRLEVDTAELARLIRETGLHHGRLALAIAEEMKTDMQLSMGTSPSAPGDPPGVDTGTLWASMRAKPLSESSAEIVDGVEYGVDLEFGTSRIAARPFVTPVVEGWRGGRLAGFVIDYGPMP